ncbi:hypothetical protein EVAR_797_1 [Eumeta japonica]|uniref:Uncharacterized protein n=1 Tax=Eumeta variegata TaxID=151549 RepID=A0A4C1SC87_EUMVA|nr:hypothetical protein EVAR_797_1 [Eumeta japonica]
MENTLVQKSTFLQQLLGTPPPAPLGTRTFDAAHDCEAGRGGEGGEAVAMETTSYPVISASAGVILPD